MSLRHIEHLRLRASNFRVARYDICCAVVRDERGAAPAAVGASISARQTVSHPVIWACARPPRSMIPAPTRGHDKRCSCCGGDVALYVGEDAGAYHCLGGNQSDKVCITRIAKSRLSCAPAGLSGPARQRSQDHAGLERQAFDQRSITPRAGGKWKD